MRRAPRGPRWSPATRADSSPAMLAASAANEAAHAAKLPAPDGDDDEEAPIEVTRKVFDDENSKLERESADSSSQTWRRTG